MPNGEKEEYTDTVNRIVNALREQLNVGFTEEEEERYAEYQLALKGSVAGRFLWQLGTHTVKRRGLSSLQNCAFTVVDNPIRPFCWAMDMLGLGSGVGYNIQRKHINKIPPVKDWFKAPTRFDDGGADFIVPDSLEGWVKLLGKTLKAAFLSDSPEKGTFTYSTQVIRGKGKPIKGFGGVASGPEDLVWGIQSISEILIKRAGKQIRPVDALDIMNIIGYIIVAGNVRRSAQIAIGDPDDVEFLLAKRWDMGVLPKWRGMSNNSVVCNDLNELHDYFWQGYEGRGEPYGLINLELAKSVGRLGETQYPDPEVEGFNPCAEQSLAPYETCCLAEVFLPNIQSKGEFFDVLELLYRICKHSLTLKSHHPETTAIVEKNMRMGIGLTGILQCTPEQLSWRSEGYEFLRELDKAYSEENDLNPSIKLTTVKPSGTLSLLPGVLPGIHPGYARYMYRRIRIAADNPLVEICRKHGYPIEYARNIDKTEDYGTVVVTFPFAYPENAVLAKDMTAIKQMELVRDMQKHWSDNSVSCTIYYRPEELPEIKEYLKKYYKYNFKTLSFLLHQDHGFDQAPYEEISKEEYDRLVRETKIIENVSTADFDSSDECATGHCPIR
jgi:hypothetical protein